MIVKIFIYIDPGDCLNNKKSLIGWFDGDSMNLDSNVWTDKTGIGYNNNGIITGNGINIDQGTNPLNEVYLNKQKVVTGTSSTKIIFNPWLLPEHTIFNLCKYRESGTKKRILQSTAANGLIGFWNGRSGVAEVNGKWIAHRLINLQQIGFYFKTKSLYEDKIDLSNGDEQNQQD